MPYSDYDDVDLEIWDLISRRPRLYEDPELDIPRFYRFKYRKVQCVSGETLRFIYGEYVHFRDGDFVRKCPHLDLKGCL